MWVVIPVKKFADSKRRLATVLTTEERATLAEIMLADVLNAVRNSARVTGILRIP